MTGGRILVLAAAWDEPARAFAAHHAAAGAVLVTPRDLSLQGWSFQLGAPDDARLVIGGAPLAAREARAVLTRLSAVTATDLPHIAGEDRDYVAAEMTAFLLSLLSGLQPRVLNRPTPQCLCGPLWSEAKWRLTAARLGLPTAPLRRYASLRAETDLDPPGTEMAVVGGATFGDAVDPDQAAAALALARAAGADLLTVIFEAQPPHRLLGATPHVDLQDPGIAEAVLTLAGACDRGLDG